MEDLGLDDNGEEITTKAEIVVEDYLTPLGLNDFQTISLRKGERKWYSFTAPETDTYIFQKDDPESTSYVTCREREGKRLR